MPKKNETSGGKAPVMQYGTGLSDAANFLKFMKKLGTYLIKERGPASYLTFSTEIRHLIAYELLPAPCIFLL